MSTFLIVIVVFVVLLGLIIISLYNSLTRKRNEVENAFAGMDTQLKKRYDLIPNLVNSVKQFMNHEKELLEGITQLRNKAMNAGSTEEKVSLDNQIAGSLGKIMVAVENYPDLKSNTNFLNLQRTLNEVESQISAARRAYNAAVTAFNNGIETFPGNIMAGAMNLTRKQVFEISEVERGNVDVGNLFNN